MEPGFVPADVLSATAAASTLAGLRVIQSVRARTLEPMRCRYRQWVATF